MEEREDKIVSGISASFILKKCLNKDCVKERFRIFLIDKGAQACFDSTSHSKPKKEANPSLAVEATCIIKSKKPLIVVAVRYRRYSDKVPVIVARGANKGAKIILEKAVTLPVLGNKNLAKGLFKNHMVGDFIQERYYQPVAEVLAFLYPTWRNC